MVQSSVSITSDEVAVLGEGVVRARITEDCTYHRDIRDGFWKSFNIERVGTKSYKDNEKSRTHDSFREDSQQGLSSSAL